MLAAGSGGCRCELSLVVSCCVPAGGGCWPCCRFPQWRLHRPRHPRPRCSRSINAGLPGWPRSSVMPAPRGRPNRPGKWMWRRPSASMPPGSRRSGANCRHASVRRNRSAGRRRIRVRAAVLRHAVERVGRWARSSRFIISRACARRRSANAMSPTGRQACRAASPSAGAWTTPYSMRAAECPLAIWTAGSSGTVPVHQRRAGWWGRWRCCRPRDGIRSGRSPPWRQDRYTAPGRARRAPCTRHAGCG